MKIQQIKNLFQDVSEARFNLAVWQKQHGDSIYFIGREVAKAGETGEPDTGILKLFEMTKEGTLVQERVIWQPLFDGINLEDPRAFETANDSLIIGLTAVMRDKKGIPIPYPALVKIDSHSDWNHELPPFLVIGTFGSGKNLTPIDRATFLFRPDSADYFHKLLVFSLHNQVPEKLGDIQFPTDLPWASWRIGTTMPPVWLSPDEALFIVHGISIQTIEGKQKYIYSIGRAKLTRRNGQFTVKVASDPILTPDNFLKENGQPLVQELHPDLRRVVYSCGGLIKKYKQDTLSLYVNVGDRSTFEVEFFINELKEGLF